MLTRLCSMHSCLSCSHPSLSYLYPTVTPLKMAQTSNQVDDCCFHHLKQLPYTRNKKFWCVEERFGSILCWGHDFMSCFIKWRKVYVLCHILNCF